MDAEGSKPSRSYRALATGTEKLYMGIAAFEALVVFTIAWTAFGLVEVNTSSSDAKERTVPVYIVIFIMAQVFSLIYVFDALRARNIVQLVLHLFFNLCISVYSILQIPQTRDAMSGLGDQPCGHFIHCIGSDSLFNTLEKIYIVTPVIIGLCTIAFAYLIRRLYEQFGWAVFHLVGASPEMKRMHREYQTLISLLKLLLFFGLAFCVAYLILVATRDGDVPDLVLTSIALPLVPLTVLAIGWALRKENKPLMFICLGLMVAGLAFFIYKLASLFLPATADLYSNTKITLALFTVFAILILMASFGYGCICASNFGRGLLDAHNNPENRTSLWAIPANRAFNEKMRREEEESVHSPAANRLVID